MPARKLLVLIRFCSGKVHRRTPFSQVWHDSFGKHLLFTNTWTSGVLMVAGDLIEQEIEYQRDLKSKRYDWARVGRMFLTGLVFGPLHHYFYGWMERALPKRTLNSVSQKILLDQFVMSPFCIATLFYSMGTLEGKDITECSREFKNKFLHVYMMDWCVWPPAQFLNFFYIPVKYQVLYINAITMVYNVFLSYIKHRDTVSASTSKRQSGVLVLDKN